MEGRGERKQKKKDKGKSINRSVRYYLLHSLYLLLKCSVE